MTANRYPLAAGRELLVMVVEGRAFATIHGPDAVCTTGPLAVHLEDVGPVCRALAQETGAGLDVERVRAVLRNSPGVAGYKRLRAALTGMSMTRRRAAVRALQDAGEVVDRGERGRPRLYIAPKAGYSHRNPHETTGVGAWPSQEPDALCDAGRTPPVRAADVAPTEVSS